jgi:hypothetical protein
MAALPLARLGPSLVAGLTLLLAVTLLAPAGAQGAQETQRRSTNPTGTTSGSAANGAGNLRTSLMATADGRVKVSWRVRAGSFRRFVVRVGPSRQLASHVKTYRVGRARRTVVVRQAFGASPASGNYSFVKVIAVKRRGGTSQSPTKWIQAPITRPCTAAAADQVTVAAFNVRTWRADSAVHPVMSWTRRAPNVVSEILRSGAHAVAIQEASGQASSGFGALNQREAILGRVNLTDSDPTARWVDALDDDDYRPPPGRKPGLVGTRVFYDASKFTALASGLGRITDPAATTDSLIPWVRLRATGGNQASFVLTSNHIESGDSRKAWEIRGRQTVATVRYLQGLRARFGDPVVLAGDLNSNASTLPSNNVHSYLMAAGFYDAFASRRLVGAQYPTTNQQTFPLNITPLRRDYILTLGGVPGSCSFRNQTYQAVSQVASDHFLQVATLPLPG